MWANDSWRRLASWSVSVSVSVAACSCSILGSSLLPSKHFEVELSEASHLIFLFVCFCVIFALMLFSILLSFKPYFPLHTILLPPLVIIIFVIVNISINTDTPLVIINWLWPLNADGGSEVSTVASQLSTRLSSFSTLVMFFWLYWLSKQIPV